MKINKVNAVMLFCLFIYRIGKIMKRDLAPSNARPLSFKALIASSCNYVPNYRLPQQHFHISFCICFQLNHMRQDIKKTKLLFRETKA